MLLMLYFHSILGPDVIFSDSEEFLNNLDENVLDDIKRLIDTANPGFFTHDLNKQLKSANYFFTLRSAWARGRHEMVMLTKILQEKEPDMEYYEREFSKFAEKLNKNGYPYFKAFYFRKHPADKKSEVNEAYEKLKEEFNTFSQNLYLDKIKMHGDIVSYGNMLKNSSIPLDPDLINQIIKDFTKSSIKEESPTNKGSVKKIPNFFSITQIKNGRIKSEIIPIITDVVLKISLFFKHSLSPKIIQSIVRNFQKNQIKVIYSAGICSAGKSACVYEAFIDGRPFSDHPEIVSKLSLIENIERIEFEEIALK